MKILVFGDIYGRIGREALKKELAKLKDNYKPDFIIANIDNVTSGRGAILKHINELKEIGVDLMTGGDHIYDNADRIGDYLNDEKSLVIRPLNFYESNLYKNPGKGYKIIEKNGKKLLVIHLMGEVFTKFRIDNPFLKVNDLLEKYKNEKFDGIIIDFHKEATSEGYGLAHFLNGKVSLVYGTHTHVQTNDEHILDGGTGLISDVGMNGSYDSVIGATYESVERMFLTGILRGKIDQSLDKKYIVNGVFVEIGDNLKCEKIEKIFIKGKL